MTDAPLADRHVRRVHAAADESRQPFSSYLGDRNLILLGDPGAGKSHLFGHFSAVEKGQRILARTFLSLPSDKLPRDRAIYIDALDEKRAGRSDRGTIDALVTRLAELVPPKVRIACRVADWLGDTDLAALNGYFGLAGGCTVLALEALTEPEQHAVLKSQGISDPKGFIEEAERRGLAELLGNPQNLVMLAAVVRHGDWPSSRTELFESSTQALLSEHNLSHTRTPSGSYSAHELVDAAGEICAVRLISDIGGISLSEVDSPDFPAYRQIAPADPSRAYAALSRRIFVGGPASETVDYVHRTLAEYLAARWLAKRISEGLPIQRALALIGVGGKPASELRGLHAWLAVIVKEGAESLIKADPYGVLTYGDAASLTPAKRRVLVEALAELAKVDPWFRSDWSARTVAALSAPDMIDAFRTVLNSPDTGFPLRSIVLDAISVGPPLPAMLADLAKVFANQDAPYAERASSLEALLRLGDSGREQVRAIFPGLGTSESDLRLRSEVLEATYGNGVGPDDVARLLRAAIETDAELPGGAFYGLDRGIPDSSLEDVLDALDFTNLREVKDRFRNSSEVVHVLDGLIARYLALNKAASGARLLSWLQKREQCDEDHRFGLREKLRDALLEHEPALGVIAETLVGGVTATTQPWLFLRDAGAISLGALSNERLLGQVLSRLATAGAEKPALYELAFCLTYSIGPSAHGTFERLCEIGESDDGLRKLRSHWCVAVIPDWRIENQKHALESDRERTIVRTKQLEEFDKYAEQIRNGTHANWLGFLGSIYFSRFNDLDRDAPPRERLSTFVGSDRLPIALEGLRALARRFEPASCEDVLAIHAEGKYMEFWYGVLAGLDELAEAGCSTDDWPVGFAEAVVAIDCLHPTYWHEGNTTHHIEHPWKVELIRKRPAVVAAAYAAVMKQALSGGATHVDGLYELLGNDAFAAHRTPYVAEALRLHPNAAPLALSRLLSVAIASLDLATARSLIDGAKAKVPDTSDQALMWLSAGYLVDPTSFRTKVEALHGAEVQRFVWVIRDMAGRGRGVQSKRDESARLTIDQLAFLIEFVGKEFKRTPHPSSSMGDTNAWDATEFVRSLIALLSAEVSGAAGQALERLVNNPSLASYNADLRHALASQKVLQIDAAYDQPGWRDVVEALSNGAPANIADLQALVLDHLHDLDRSLRGSNTDPYKQFWNVDQWGRPTEPKPEEVGRDALVTMLRPRLSPHGLSTEPEGHMAHDKRTDIAIFHPKAKLVVELKRDCHGDLWEAAQTQLERLYTRDPDAKGYGIYGVFWYGEKRKSPIPAVDGEGAPTSPSELQQRLQARVPEASRDKVRVIVLDVSGEG